MKKFKPYDLLFDSNPLLRLVVPYALGIVVGEQMWYYCSGYSFVFFISSLFLIFICMAVFRRNMEFGKKGTVFVTTLYSSMILLGAGAQVEAVDAQQVVWENHEQDLRAVIIQTPKQNEKLWQVVAQVVGGEHDGQKVRLALLKSQQGEVGSQCADTVLEKAGNTSLGKPSVRQASSVGSALPAESRAFSKTDSYSGNGLKTGDVLLLHALFSYPKNRGNPCEFDYAKWATHQGIVGDAFCVSGQWKKSRYGAADLSLPLRVLRFREKLSENYQRYFEGRSLAILSAMTLGDKTHLDACTRDLFSQTGVSHVLALSGLHLSILYYIYSVLILSLCRRRWLHILMSVVGIGGLWGFALMAGLPLSLMRAAIMFSILQLMACLRHDSFSINNLAFAALCLLLYSPQTLFDVGFQLSFLSVFFIILFANQIPRPAVLLHCKVLNFGYSLLATSFCAQLATAPLVAYYFHTFPVLGFVANLVAVPMAYLILGVAVLFFAFPFLQEFTAGLLGHFLLIMERALSSLSTVPGAVIELYPTAISVGLFYLLLFSFLSYILYRKTVGLYGVSVLMLCIGVLEIYSHRPDKLQPQLIVYNLGKVPAVHCISSKDKSYLWSSDYPKADSCLMSVKRTFWKAEGVKSPVLLRTPLANEYLFYDERVVSFDGFRIGLCCGPLPKGKPESPLRVDYLLLARGVKGDIADWLNYYSPQTVVLDASLTDYYYNRYLGELVKMKVGKYDIRKQGALVIQ